MGLTSIPLCWRCGAEEEPQPTFCESEALGSLRHTYLGTFILDPGDIKGRFTHSMPFPCREYAVPLPCRAAKGLECVFPIWFTQCGLVWFTLAMPCPYYAPTMPFFSRPLNSTAVSVVIQNCIHKWINSRVTSQNDCYSIQFRIF